MGKKVKESATVNAATPAKGDAGEKMVKAEISEKTKAAKATKPKKKAEEAKPKKATVTTSPKEASKKESKLAALESAARKTQKHHHNPSGWMSHTDLIVRLDNPVEYVGKAGKVGHSMPKIDVDQIVYETVDEVALLKSDFNFGIVYSVPPFLKDKYTFGDRIYFVHHKKVDYDTRFALVPPHVNIGIAEHALEEKVVIDIKNGAKTNKGFKARAKRCCNTIGRFFKKFRFWVGSTNVSK